MPATPAMPDHRPRREDYPDRTTWLMALSYRYHCTIAAYVTDDIECTTYFDADQDFDSVY